MGATPQPKQTTASHDNQRRSSRKPTDSTSVKATNRLDSIDTVGVGSSILPSPTLNPPDSGGFRVGDGRIELPTPTVSMLSSRLVAFTDVESVGFRELRRWLSWLAVVCFGCGVAPMRPQRH